MRIPIAVKLIAVTLLMIVATVVPISLQNSKTFESTFSKSQDDANAELANTKAIEVEGVFLKYSEKIRLVTELLLQDFADELQRKRALDLVLARDLDLVNVEVYHLVDGKPHLYRRETNDSFLNSFELDRKFIDRLRREKYFPFMSLFADKNKIHLQNSSIRGGVPLLTMGLSFSGSDGIVKHIALADLRLDKLQKGFAIGGARILYLVDESGATLAHTNEGFALSAKNLMHIPIVDEGMKKRAVAQRGQKRFFDPEAKEWYVGAYAHTAFGPSVIVQAPESIILQPAKILRQSTIEVALYVFWVVLFFVFLFSWTLTAPIERLRFVTRQVAKGNFDIRARLKSNDEVGDLGKALNNMIDGLKERDKVKNILNKFHGSSVTDSLMKGDLNLGGSRKEVVVFFSDIRDFTKFSEGHTPEEVVEMLNEYFHIMVGIISRHGGIVDKFVGDAIMAVWGAPTSSGDDCFHAVRASLDMRIALDELNQRRLQRGHTAIKIGIGLHAGPAISGTIGSTERMEYTVIGDTVNMASRIEASTKAFGTDLLVSDTVGDKVQEKFKFELAGTAVVKGKSEPIRMYKVKGSIENGVEHVVRTPYSEYEASGAEKVKVA